MSSAAGMRSTIGDARNRLAEGREKLKVYHQSGASGMQVCAHMADLMDTVLLDLIRDAYDEATDGDREKLEGRVALIPHGGYGRRDVAPYSDADLMLLYRGDSYDLAEKISHRLSHDIFDVGIDLGFSVRTTRQAYSLAAKEPEVFTSLCESRYLSGSVGLFRGLMSRLARQSKNNVRLVAGVQDKRLEERLKYGESVYMLRPNVKRSAGALRDIQLIRWLAFIRYGETDIHRISRLGGLHESDYRNLIAAREFFLRLRNELHFHSGKAQDVLGKNEQLRIAERMGYEPREDRMAVEIFMQDYFQHSSQVSYAAEHWVSSFSSGFQVRKILQPLFTRTLEGQYRVGPTHISVHRKDIDRVKNNLEEVLHLMTLANTHDRLIETETWREIRDAMCNMESVDVSPAASERFLELLSTEKRLAGLIRRLHELGVLEKLIPGFKKARCLIQFNQYHKYTVDEHTLLALEKVTSYADEDSPLGKAYRSIKSPARLHMAILLHDLGKGQPGDHSEIGGRMAQETCTRLGMQPGDTKAIRFLVEKHLVMADLAFRRDISDESVVAQFAADVGRPDYLQMLYVLTCADITSVGPEVMTGWKMNFLTELYHRTMMQLSGENVADAAIETVEPIRDRIKSFAEDEPDTDWYARQVDSMPPHFVADVVPKDVFRILKKLNSLAAGSLAVRQRYLKKQKATEILIGKHDEEHWDIFYKLIGAISGAGLNIMNASISYLNDPLVLYRFVAVDSDYKGEPPKHRSQDIKKRIEKSLGQDSPKPVFRKTWGAAKTTRADVVARKPPRVRFDNQTAESSTIIDIFATDRTGLLYTIVRKLFDLDLRVRVAKIVTIVDEVVDVFYVTDKDGNKILDKQVLESIRDQLLQAVEMPDENTD